MKKKIVVIMFASLFAASITACGESGNAVKSETQTSETTQEESSDSEVQEENGMRKEPVYTNKELGITGSTGPINYNIEGIQISKLTATTDDAAQLIGVDKDKEVTLVAINASAENTSDDTVNFYIGQATLTSNTKEQVDSDMLLSDYIDGEFLGNVIHSGTLIYILPNSAASDVTTVTLHISAPSGSDYMPIGDDVTIDIPIS